MVDQKVVRSFGIILTGADQIILGPNEHRKLLIISPPITAGDLFITFSKTAVANNGLHITSTNNPVFLHLDDIGNELLNEIHAISSVAGTVGIIEVSGR